MIRGEISNQYEGRIVFVWEGLLAHRIEGTDALEARYVRWKRWRRAFSCWEEDRALRHAVSDAFWRSGMNVDVLITHPAPFAELVTEYLEATNFPYHRVYNYSLEAFDRELAFLPEVVGVWHKEVNRPFLFGGKGLLWDYPGTLRSYLG